MPRPGEEAGFGPFPSPDPPAFYLPYSSLRRTSHGCGGDSEDRHYYVVASPQAVTPVGKTLRCSPAHRYGKAPGKVAPWEGTCTHRSAYGCILFGGKCLSTERYPLWQQQLWA
jgi:hypothetical protein